ncbi:hypothetical protein BOTBODRAFT_513293 [Botryobasidium botryosum FD-172 SS1]|uniref:UEV domain-containing protein n=1 Tax=Botryobasidium botryosum (strain FD-172 SS1) TaxID=930990 RepID=A0A067N2Y4_BOTB1|nr:hypothetical protein BOTBODRAFT_513293 [Botryobasidium botryosum FD-172 SS1]
MASGNLTLTQKWLRGAASPYQQEDRVYLDVDAVLASHPTLRPKTDVYTFNDGRTQLLICVHGLLPITFRQSTYNIPVAIWLPLGYPKDVPIAYVVPTSDMLIKAGKHVDLSGSCVIPYLADWQKKSEACNLRALAEAMQDIFSREPPLYAKPKRAVSNPPVSSPVQAPATAGPSNEASSRPALPPKPPHAIGTPLGPPPSAQHHTSPISRATYVNEALASRPPPPLPSEGSPRTVSIISSQPTPHHGAPRTPPPPPPPPPRPPIQHPSPLAPYNTGNMYNKPPPIPPSDIPTPAFYAPPAAPPPPPTSAPPGQSSRPLYTSPPPHPAYTTNHDRYQSPPVPPPHPMALPTRPASLPTPAPIRNIMEEDDTDPQFSTTPSSSSIPPAAFVPPRPPNPETLRMHAALHAKLTAELNTVSQTLATDAERLRANQADLLAGEPAIRDEMARLEAVRDVCRTVGGRMRSVVGAAEGRVEELRRKGDPDVDELVCSTTIVYNQLINLVAEDNAIEDTIYHLHRALNAGRIDLDRFIRTTRVLAEEQFMKRALIEKITSGIPMGATMGSWS